MLRIIKKKICWVIFLLSSFSLSSYGMKRSFSCADMYLRQVEHKCGHYGGLKSGLYEVFDLDYRGRIKNSVSINNPVEIPPKAMQILFDKNYQKKTIFLVPKKLPEPIPLWRQCFNIFNMVWNNPMVEKYVEEKIFSTLTIFLQSHFLMESKDKIQLREQLFLEIEKGKVFEEELQEQEEGLKKDSRYFKQLSLFNGYSSLGDIVH